MKISKIVLWLSVIDAFLVLLASASGILFKSIYARETPTWALRRWGRRLMSTRWARSWTLEAIRLS